MSPPSSGSKNKPSKKPPAARQRYISQKTELFLCCMKLCENVYSDVVLKCCVALCCEGSSGAPASEPEDTGQQHTGPGGPG
jgi:hypothetical protein